jgi:hypothetical protein
MNDSNVFNGSDFYRQVYATTASKVIGLAASVVIILVLVPLFYSISWYEKYGSNQVPVL